MHQGEDTKISELEQISVILPQELNAEELSTSLQTVTIIHNPTIIQVSETPITYQYYQTLEDTSMSDQNQQLSQTINISVPAIHYQTQSWDYIVCELIKLFYDYFSFFSAKIRIC